ncbi:hypothetical protein B9G52_10520 [Bacillus safensis]|nr:hypothetical protein [Bacillus safensis]
MKGGENSDKFYYYNINTDINGNHEVHTEDCSYLPDTRNREYIGYEPDCKSAINRAKRETSKYNFDGCYYCCNECHTG